MNSFTTSQGLAVLYKKEVSDHLRSKRFTIILVLVAIICIASVYSVGLGIREAISKDKNEFVFLKLFTVSGGSLPSFVSFMSFLGPLIGLSLGFDIINGEKARGTLSRLLAQPIYRDTVINGKFLAGISILSIMVISLGLAVGGLGIILIGIPPTFEEFARISIYLILTILYIGLWFAISLMFSLIFRQTATSALAGIALWLFLSIFVGLIAGIIADGLYPPNSHSSIDVVVKNQLIKQNIGRISPSKLYDEAVITILNPGVRSVGIITSSQLEGAIPGTLPLGQSIMLIWAHLVTMIAMIVICFAISYVLFMKQEIRAI